MSTTRVVSLSVLFNEPKLLKSPAARCRDPPYSRLSVLFNEPKLLKSKNGKTSNLYKTSFSALQRAEIAEIEHQRNERARVEAFSALQRAEIAEICLSQLQTTSICSTFSALQRAEIAEIRRASQRRKWAFRSFSALQRAEIAEIAPALRPAVHPSPFSALQRAEIAEILYSNASARARSILSVLFNEPKLLKSGTG